MKKTILVTLEVEQAMPASAVYQAVHALANSIAGELEEEAEHFRIRQTRLNAALAREEYEFAVSAGED